MPVWGLLLHKHECILPKPKWGSTSDWREKEGVSTRIPTPMRRRPTELVQCPGSCSSFLGTGTHSSWAKNSGFLLPHHFLSQNGRLGAKEIPTRRQPKQTVLFSQKSKRGFSTGLGSPTLSPGLAYSLGPPVPNIFTGDSDQNERFRSLRTSQSPHIWSQGSTKTHERANLLDPIIF